MNKVYIVTFNTDAPFNVVTFHNYLTSLYPRSIIDWWHYIHTTYLIVSPLDVSSLYKLIYPGVPQRYLLIVEIDPNNAQGWLPRDAWAWLQKYKRL
jgi:hypothetical protein